MPPGYLSARAGVGIVFRLQEKSGQIIVHSLNRGGAAMMSGKVQEGDELLTVSGVALNASARPVGALSEEERAGRAQRSQQTMSSRDRCVVLYSVSRHIPEVQEILQRADSMRVS